MAQQQERKVPVARSNNSLIDQEFDSIREKFEVEMQKMEQEMGRFRQQLIESERSRLVSSAASQVSSTSSVSATTTTSSSRSTTGGRVQSSSESMKVQEQKKQLESGDKFSSQAISSSSKSSRSTIQESVLAKERAGTGLLGSVEQAQKCKNAAYQSRDDFMGAQQQQHLLGQNWLSDIDSPLIKDSAGGKILKLRFDVEQYEPDQIVVKTEGNRLQVQAKREDSSANQTTYREYNREFLLPSGIDPELIRSTLSADGILTVEAPLSIDTN